MFNYINIHTSLAIIKGVITPNIAIYENEKKLNISIGLFCFHINFKIYITKD